MFYKIDYKNPFDAARLIEKKNWNDVDDPDIKFYKPDGIEHCKFLISMQKTTSCSKIREIFKGRLHPTTSNNFFQKWIESYKTIKNNYKYFTAFNKFMSIGSTQKKITREEFVKNKAWKCQFENSFLFDASLFFHHSRVSATVPLIFFKEHCKKRFEDDKIPQHLVDDILRQKQTEENDEIFIRALVYHASTESFKKIVIKVQGVTTEIEAFVESETMEDSEFRYYLSAMFPEVSFSIQQQNVTKTVLFNVPLGTHSVVIKDILTNHEIVSHLMHMNEVVTISSKNSVTAKGRMPAIIFDNGAFPNHYDYKTDSLVPFTCACNATPNGLYIRFKRMGFSNGLILFVDKFVGCIETSQHRILSSYNVHFTGVEKITPHSYRAFVQSDALFVNKYSRICGENNRPQVIPANDKHGYTDILRFPRFTENGVQPRYFSCLNKNSPYIGLKTNTLDNSKDFPLVPCCFKTPQLTKPNSKVSQYLRSAFTTSAHYTNNVASKFMPLAPVRKESIPGDIPSAFNAYLNRGLPSNTLWKRQAMGPSLSIILDIFGKTRSDLAMFSASCIGQFPGKSEQDIKKQILDKSKFISPTLYRRALEDLLNVHIMVFRVEKKSISFGVEPQRHTRFAFPLKEDAIFVLEFPIYKRCELLGFSPKKSTFYSKLRAFPNSSIGEFGHVIIQIWKHEGRMHYDFSARATILANPNLRQIINSYGLVDALFDTAKKVKIQESKSNPFIFPRFRSASDSHSIVEKSTGGEIERFDRNYLIARLIFGTACAAKLRHVVITFKETDEDTIIALMENQPITNNPWKHPLVTQDGNKLVLLCPRDGSAAAIEQTVLSMASKDIQKYEHINPLIFTTAYDFKKKSEKIINIKNIKSAILPKFNMLCELNRTNISTVEPYRLMIFGQNGIPPSFYYVYFSPKFMNYELSLKALNGLAIDSTALQLIKAVFNEENETVFITKPWNRATGITFDSHFLFSTMLQVNLHPSGDRRFYPMAEKISHFDPTFEHESQLDEDVRVPVSAGIIELEDDPDFSKFMDDLDADPKKKV